VNWEQRICGVPRTGALRPSVLSWSVILMFRGSQHELIEAAELTVTGDNAYVVVPLVHDIQSARQTGHADWRDLYGGSPQAQRRVAQMIASGQDFARDL